MFRWVAFVCNGVSLAELPEIEFGALMSFHPKTDLSEFPQMATSAFSSAGLWSLTLLKLHFLAERCPLLMAIYILAEAQVTSSSQ